MSRRELPFSSHPGFSGTQWVVPSPPVVEGTLEPHFTDRKQRLGFLKELPTDKAGKWQSWNLVFVVTTLHVMANYLFNKTGECIYFFNTFSSDNRNSYKWSLVKT